MTTNSPDANSRPSKSPRLPKEDTTTLRQQLIGILYKNTFTDERFYSEQLRDDVLAELERLCQEIAREAALKELEDLYDISKGPLGEHVRRRIAQLTQQPPEAT